MAHLGGTTDAVNRREPADVAGEVAVRLDADQVSLWRTLESPPRAHELVATHPGSGPVWPLPDASCAADTTTTWCLPVSGESSGRLLVSAAAGSAGTRDLLGRVTAELSPEIDRLLRDSGVVPEGPVAETLDASVLAALGAPETAGDLEAILNGLRGRLAGSGLTCAVGVWVQVAEGSRPVFCDPVLARPPVDQECLALVGRVLSTGRLVVGGEPVGPDPEVTSSSSPPREETARLLGVPLWRGGTVLGVMVVAVPAAAALSDEDSRAVTETASLVGSTVDRARLDSDQDHRLAVASARRALLEAGVRSCSVIEAAEAIARTVAESLEVPIGCTYLVDKSKRITDLAAVGATPEQEQLLRERLIGRLGSGSPVWQNSIEVPEPGPYFLDDTGVVGSTRPGGGMAEVLGYRCLATIPLLASDGPIGVVVCGDDRGPRRWQPGEHLLASELAMQGTILLDNARLREAERHQASHDALTGLLNRAAFQERLRQELSRCSRSGEPLSILLLDLNRFKEVNDTLGHGPGDTLLVEVAQRLRKSLRDADVVARIGGDEFAVLLPGTDTEGAAVAAEHVDGDLGAPIQLAGRLVQVGASIGIASYPDHGTDSHDLVRLADTAMYVAKRNALPYAVADPISGRAERPSRLEQTAMLGELARAISDDELVLAFQPKVDTRTDAVVGVEALVRWRHPRRGLLGPGEFVPLAERSGVIRRLTGWVVPQVLQQCRDWLARGLDISVALNASAQDITDPHFVDRVAESLAASGVPARNLVVELTETALLLDLPGALRTLSQLQGLGVRTSLDDFGTGYSALSYLSTLPIDELKLDGSFFPVGMPERAGMVLESVITLAHRLGLTVVGERVETPELVARLAELGCDQTQGHVHAPPLTPTELLDWIEARQSHR